MDRSKDSSYWIEKLNMSPHPRVVILKKYIVRTGGNLFPDIHPTAEC